MALWSGMFVLGNVQMLFEMRKNELVYYLCSVDCLLNTAGLYSLYHFSLLKNDYIKKELQLMVIKLYYFIYFEHLQHIPCVWCSLEIHILYSTNSNTILCCENLHKQVIEICKYNCLNDCFIWYRQVLTPTQNFGSWV